MLSYFSNLVLLLFTIQICRADISDDEHICGDAPMNNSELVNGIHIDPAPVHLREKRSVNSPFRIHFDYTSNFQSDPNQGEIKNLIMEPAKAILANLVKPVIPVEGLLRVDRPCTFGAYRTSNGKKACQHGCLPSPACSNVAIPSKYLKKCKTMDSSGQITESGFEGSGIANTDLVVIVERVDCTDRVLAWANSCFLEEELDRPILGVINLCKNSITIKPNNDKLIKLVVHELIHVLGFSAHRYAYFRDKEGKPLVPRDAFGWPNLGIENGIYRVNSQIAKTVTRQRSSKPIPMSSKKMTGLTLPNVLIEARTHFNCPSLDAVDLEDSGSSVSAGSHFDEYAYHDEIMSPVIFKVEYVSRITLAFLYDTGWYNVKFCGAEQLEYGKKSGCVLATQGCNNYMMDQKSKGQSIQPFCDTLFTEGNSYSCSSDRNNMEYCYMESHSSLNPSFQYFSNSSWGGSSAWMEYCPIKQTVNCEADSLDRSKIPPVSYFGKDSKCYGYTTDGNNSTLYEGAVCMKTQCGATPYTFLYGSTSKTCPASGSFVDGAVTVSCDTKSVQCQTPTNPPDCSTWTDTKPPEKFASVLKIPLKMMILALFVSGMISL